MPSNLTVIRMSGSITNPPNSLTNTHNRPLRIYANSR